MTSPLPLICVVDASVAIKGFLTEALSAEATALLALLADPANQFHVPDLFYAECANILWKYVQRGKATAAQVEALLADLLALPFLSTPAYELAGEALKIANKYSISAYDGCYAALAAKRGGTLITADQKLQMKLAAGSVAITWLGAWKYPASP